MNEKVAKKIGEAYAFANVLQKLQDDNKEVIKDLLGEYSDSIKENTETQISELTNISEKGDQKETVITKAEKTSNKITEMGNFYVGDDWDDSAEVLEWLSFFLGAAIVHWQLILGSAKAMGDESFAQVAESGAAYYFELLQQSRIKAEEIGAERSRD
ncbi:MAG: hypothetical protein ACOCUH_00010 [Bacteriovoracia bacterium]